MRPGIACAHCGKPLHPKRTGRPPHFCCDACKKSAFSARTPASRYDGKGPAGNTVIRAQLIGSDTASAGGITVRAYAPVLELCRRLLAAGNDPATALQAYRGATLALTVSSIGWGAKYTIQETSKAGPYLVRWKPFPSFAGRPPIAPSASALSPTDGTKQAPAQLRKGGAR
jgi:hypothetical protein